MTQPEHVPTALADRVRDEERLPAHGGWHATRPADAAVPEAPAGLRLGHPGPDQGYALHLARYLADRIELRVGEHDEDALAGCVAVGMRRAGLFGRAPVIYDLDVAFTLWGFMTGAPGDLVAFRRPHFGGCSHDYWKVRDIVDHTREEALRLTPAQVRDRLTGWRDLLVTDRPVPV